MARQNKKSQKKEKVEITEAENKLQDTKMRFKFWLYEKYEMAFIPQYFFDKLETVYDGTYKNLTSPIPIDDLWDMWDRKMPELLKTYEWNKKKGNVIEGVGRLSYDLAVILSKYDSYLAWKSKQKQAQYEKQQKENEENIDYSNLTLIKHNSSQKNEVDINKFLDEI